MKKLAILTVALLALSGALGSVVGAKEKPVYFDYNEFEAVRALDPNMTEARLCGMNKACMKLWRNGDMLATEHGMVVRADFNGDGQTDIAVALEKDHPDSLDVIDYYVIAAARSKDGGLRLMETVPFPPGHSIVEMLWDDKKHAISVDTGERQLVSQSTVTMLGSGNILGGLSKKTGEVEIRLTFLNWDSKTRKFDVSHGTFKI
jgi:hypothetical protein